MMRAVSAVFAVLLMVWGESAYSQEESPGPAADMAFHEVYGGLYLLGSLAKNRNLNVGGEALPQTTVRDGAGGGIHAGVFPAFTHRIEIGRAHV